MRKSTLVLLVLLAAVAVVRLWVLRPPSTTQTDEIDTRSLYPAVSRIIQEHYVDPVDPAKAWPGAYAAMLKRLDNFGAYISPEYVTSARAWRQGKGFWAGVWISPTERGFVVSRILPESPAERSSLRVGDFVESVDGNGLAGRTWGAARLMLYAQGEREFQLGVNRVDLQRPLQITISAIALPPDVDINRLSDRTTHVDLYRLTPAAVRALSEKFKSLPRHNWIIDLRNYLHGDLVSCLSVADLLLPPSTRLDLRTRSGNQRISTGRPGIVPPGMTVLTGPATIMYAEILARLMQAAGAPLVGEKTGGFAAHLRRVSLPDGGELVLVDGHFYWDGKNVQHEPLIPDERVVEKEAALARARAILRDG